MSAITPSPSVSYQRASSAVRSSAGAVLILFFSFALALYFYLRPSYTPDTVAYLEYSQYLNGVPVAQIPAATDSILHAVVPPGEIAQLTGDDWVRQIPSSFPIFSVKFAYVLAAALLHRAGLSYPDALRLINFLSVALITLVTVEWMRRYIGLPFALFASLLFQFSPFAFWAEKTLRPDSLGAAIVILGTWVAFERARPLLGTAILALSITIRPDLAINFAFSTVALFWLEDKPRKRWALAGLTIAGACAYLIPSHLLHAYPLRTLISIFFFNRQAFTWLQYARVVISNAPIVLIDCASIFLFCAMGVLSSPSMTTQQKACGWVQVLCLVRFLIYPISQNRLFLSQNLIMFVLAATLFLRRARDQRQSRNGDHIPAGNVPAAYQ